jgi:hypothetical protein
MAKWRRSPPQPQPRILTLAPLGFAPILYAGTVGVHHRPPTFRVRGTALSAQLLLLRLLKLSPPKATFQNDMLCLGLQST